VVNTRADGSPVGVRGISVTSADGVGVKGDGSGLGVFGTSESSEGWAVYGLVSATTGSTVGVNGVADSPSGTGTRGVARADTGFNRGVVGISNSISGTGVLGQVDADSGRPRAIWGVNANAPLGWAGFFDGNVNIDGTLFKSGGAFRIDHPLDPANKYLNHSFVESPDMMNVYNGNVALDGNGEFWVQLPDWFEALNKEFRYQLTPIGAPGPNLYIAEPVQNNRFKIAGGTPGLRVSWQVTGIRHDPYAEANPILVEQEKPADEKGTYAAPEAYGQPEEKGARYKRFQELHQPNDKATNALEKEGE
jgi:hypothetical protein